MKKQKRNQRDPVCTQYALLEAHHKNKREEVIKRLKSNRIFFFVFKVEKIINLNVLLFLLLMLLFFKK